MPAIRIGFFDDPEIKITDHPELARYYESLGAPDSAIAVYERYLAVTSVNRATTDAAELGPTLARLVALYAARGDRARAASYDRRLALLWGTGDVVARRRAPCLTRC